MLYLSSLMTLAVVNVAHTQPSELFPFGSERSQKKN